MSAFPYLTFLTLLPLIGSILAAMLPGNRTAFSRAAGLGFSFAALGVVLTLVLNYDYAAGAIAFVEHHDWIPALKIDYYLGADGLSLMLLLLTALVTPFALLALGSKTTKLSVTLILLLQATLFGTFTALNFIHWFIFYELSLVPVFLLIRMGGSAKATAAAFQFFVYTLLGGFAMLLAFLAIHQATGTFNLITLAGLGHSGELTTALVKRFAWIGLQPQTIGLLAFGGIFLGLAVKVPVVPFHTWLPDAYSEAPAPVSMLMTGVLSKMGVYGFLRLLMPLFPAQMQQLATPLLWLALLTIVFSALAALAQTDLKRIVAYSSINHLGYCLLGIFAVAAAVHGPANDRAAAMNGVLLQVFNHGITAAAIFCFIGFLETRSLGLRGLADFGGIRAVAPVLCGLMGISIFSSLGLPGLNGFAGEFLIFKGSFALIPWASTVAAVGLFVTAVFLLGIIQRVFTGPLNERWAKLPDLSLSERITVAPSIALMFVLGIYPQFLINLFNQTVLHLLP
ncbi:MAG: NADH-quinone oxidoreductase subunit M [Verrucomicrobiota bacterium]